MLVTPGGVAISLFSQPLSSTDEQYVRNCIFDESTRFVSSSLRICFPFVENPNYAWTSESLYDTGVWSSRPGNEYWLEIMPHGQEVYFSPTICTCMQLYLYDQCA